MSGYRRGQLRLNAVSLYWSAWLLGTVLIVLSWFRVVHPLLGWLGFFIAGAATVTSIIFNLTGGRQRRSVPIADSTHPIGVAFDENSVQISLIDGRVVSAPLTWYPKLKKASAEQRTDYVIDGNGVYWPALDADVSVLDVLDGARPLE